MQAAAMPSSLVTMSCFNLRIESLVIERSTFKRADTVAINERFNLRIESLVIESVPIA